MMTMRERVARALFADHHSGTIDGREGGSSDAAWDRACDPEWGDRDYWLGQADASIAAMRERVAQAICRARHGHDLAAAWVKDRDYWDAWLGQADAAIAAMRELMEGMEEIGKDGMTLHTSTFEYLVPPDVQIQHMDAVRRAFSDLITSIDGRIPDGPDKTYLMRQIRDCAMWANVAITRNPDGSPRN